MGVISFNGRSSSEFGCTIEQRPDHTRGSRRGELIEAPGRNGAMVLEDGSYTTYIQSYVVAFKEGGTLPPYRRAAQVAEWLLGSKGFCRLEDDFEPGFFRLARYAGPLNINQVVDAYGRCTLEFECQPQRYLKMGDTEIGMSTPFSSESVSVPGEIQMPIPYGAAAIYSLAPDAPANSFFVVYRDEDGQTVGNPLDTVQGTPMPVPAGATSIYCVWNNTSNTFSAFVGMVDSDGEQIRVCGVLGVDPILYNPTQFEARPLLQFVDTSEEPAPVQQTIIQTTQTGIGIDGSIVPASRANYTSDAISVSGFANAIVSGLGYSFFDSNGRSVGFYTVSNSSPPLADVKIVIPSTASTIVVAGSTDYGASLALQAARPNPGTKAVTINGVDISLDFSEHDTIILDCDLYDARYLDGSSANNRVSFSGNLIAYPAFPGLVPGENTVKVRDAAHLDFSVIPRWWTL